MTPADNILTYNAEWLERLIAVPKLSGSSPAQTINWKTTFCSPNSEYAPFREK